MAKSSAHEPSTSRGTRNGPQSISTLAYDPATCNVQSTTDPLGNTTTLVYDTSGNVTGVTDAKNRLMRFVYDSLNRVTKTIDATNAAPPVKAAE